MNGSGKVPELLINIQSQPNWQDIKELVNWICGVTWRSLVPDQEAENCTDKIHQKDADIHPCYQMVYYILVAM